jgi:hypothetical protein
VSGKTIIDLRWSKPGIYGFEKLISWSWDSIWHHESMDESPNGAQAHQALSNGSGKQTHLKPGLIFIH